MANIFSGTEIVEIGVQIEKNGKDFYNVLAKQSKSKKAVEIFKYLEGEEEKHIVTFQKILDSVLQYEPAQAYPGEYFAYMNALASEYIFTQKDKGKEIAKKITTDKEAIDKRIMFEKDSIVFYEGMERVVPTADHKIVDKLIEQEKNHLLQLVQLKPGL